jgi:hypothetical protein
MSNILYFMGPGQIRKSVNGWKWNCSYFMFVCAPDGAKAEYYTILYVTDWSSLQIRGNSKGWMNNGPRKNIEFVKYFFILKIISYAL